MPQAKVLESSVQKSIMQWCEANRIFVRRRNVGAIKADYKGKSRFIRFGGTGQSDLWLIHEGRHVECEVKAPGNTPTLAQMTWMADVCQAGGRAFWCSSLDEFIAKLTGKELGI